MIVYVLDFHYCFEHPAWYAFLILEKLINSDKGAEKIIWKLHLFQRRSASHDSMKINILNVYLFHLLIVC